MEKWIPSRCWIYLTWVLVYLDKATKGRRLLQSFSTSCYGFLLLVSMSTRLVLSIFWINHIFMLQCTQWSTVLTSWWEWTHSPLSLMNFCFLTHQEVPHQELLYVVWEYTCYSNLRKLRYNSRCTRIFKFSCSSSCILLCPLKLLVYMSLKLTH